uniref:Uncharacterized protein n=1 Tax=Sphaerodactylus townsendi TaxID=933632 RepID=A0ACB8FI54_9SAUR
MCGMSLKKKIFLLVNGVPSSFYCCSRPAVLFSNWYKSDIFQVEELAVASCHSTEKHGFLNRHQSGHRRPAVKSNGRIMAFVCGCLILCSLDYIWYHKTQPRPYKEFIE